MRLGTALWNRRILGWSAITLALAALGVALDAFLPAEPRWVMTSPPRTYLPMVNDILVSYAATPDSGIGAGPLQVRDPMTGQEQARFLDSTARIHAIGRSTDGRHCFAVTQTARPESWLIHRFDLQERTESYIEAALGRLYTRHDEPHMAVFSPEGQFLAVTQRA